MARRWATEILECSPLAVQTTKRLAIEALEGDLPAMIRQRSAEVVGQIFDWEDTREGIAAFAEKRPPVWRGR